MHNRQARKDDWKFITRKLRVHNISLHNFFLREIDVFVQLVAYKKLHALVAADMQQAIGVRVVLLLKWIKLFAGSEVLTAALWRRRCVAGGAA